MVQPYAHPQVIGGRYRLRQPIGDGRMSTVYLAEDTRQANTLVAIKLLNTAHPDLLRRELFRRETQALERLDHKNIVRILDHGWSEDDQCFYIVLEWLESSLTEVLKRNQRPSAKHMRALINALVYAHGAGVIHRDIKPSNVLFDASGTPKLSDFGISRLQYELASGMTVSGFWSIPYAPPEQRRGDAGDERTDIYALGVLFYQMMSRKLPSSDGPTARDIAALDLPTTLHDLLTRMLALEPENRIESMVAVYRQFHAWTTQGKPPPDVFLLITEPALRQLFDEYGLIQFRTIEAAREWLSSELAGNAQGRVPVNLDTKGNVRILGEQTSLFCERHRNLQLLIIKSIDMPYRPNLEAARESGLKVLVRWHGVSLYETQSNVAIKSAQTAKTLNSVFNEVNEHNIKQAAKKEQRIERRGFVEMWDGVLRYQRRKLDEKTRPLAFQHMGERDGALVFTLKDAPPDTLAWPEGTTLAVASHERERALPVGELLRIEGRDVIVLPQATSGSVGAPTRDSGRGEGAISLFHPEESAALKRQAAALTTLRLGESVNPRLADILTDIQGATFNLPDTSINFIQDDLAEDKREAVRQALAARDLFILQGPPGTGKTAAIAEIILQILRGNPDARILVSSQSNVAVNHVLSRVAQAHQGQRLEIIRLGRNEKIGQGAEQWQLEQRQAAWRQEVVDRCQLVREELTAQVRQRSSKSNAARGGLGEENLKLCRDWLEEAGQALEALQESTDQLGAFEEPSHDVGMEQIPQDDDYDRQVSTSRSDRLALGDVIRAQRQRLLDDLDVLRTFLPERYQGTPLGEPEAEIERLRSIIVDLSEPGAPDDPAVKLRRLVQEWSLIFGIGPEFAMPLLKRANILAATCLFTGNRTLKDETFDWVIIDEAGRATPPELLVPLVRAKRAILVGDERQLPPLLDEELAPEQLAQAGIQAENLERSLFETLVNEARQHCPAALRMLTVQHRMHPAIGALISDVFYDGRLTTMVDLRERDHQLSWLSRPVLWVSTSHLAQHSDERRGMSFANPSEVTVIEQLLRRMEADYRARGETREIGVIAGYMGQVADLIDRIEPNEPEKWRALDIEIATVDAFQGRDRDLVIYSTVRSNPQGSIGFLRDRRRLNVSLSRAKQALIVVGDATMFGAIGRDRATPFRDVLAYMREHPESCAIEPWLSTDPAIALPRGENR